MAEADSPWGKIQTGDPLDALKQEITNRITQLEMQVTEKIDQVISLIKSSPSQ